jgi:hypothetical protein
VLNFGAFLAPEREVIRRRCDDLILTGPVLTPKHIVDAVEKLKELTATLKRAREARHVRTCVMDGVASDRTVLLILGESGSGKSHASWHDVRAWMTTREERRTMRNDEAARAIVPLCFYGPDIQEALRSSPRGHEFGTFLLNKALEQLKDAFGMGRVGGDLADVLAQRYKPSSVKSALSNIVLQLIIDEAGAMRCLCGQDAFYVSAAVRAKRRPGTSPDIAGVHPALACLPPWAQQYLGPCAHPRTSAQTGLDVQRSPHEP